MAFCCTINSRHSGVCRNMVAFASFHISKPQKKGYREADRSVRSKELQYLVPCPKFGVQWLCRHKSCKFAIVTKWFPREFTLWLPQRIWWTFKITWHYIWRRTGTKADSNLFSSKPAVGEMYAAITEISKPHRLTVSETYSLSGWHDTWWFMHVKSLRTQIITLLTPIVRWDSNVS